MNIGDLILSLIADGSKLTPQVEQEAGKAGDAGAKTLNQRLASGLKTNGIKALGTAFAAAGAVATQGALQMEDAVARIRSETGATADEAERIAQTSNRIAGDQQQSLAAVTDVAIAVRKDMGLVGDQLDKVTEQTVKYARVTKQDGVGAVKALDDIGDAWNLTADQMLQVQGELLVSNQKWGGSITDNQDALAKLAPQLRALGASVDDGIALLNLFSASGLDSSKALAALNTAVTKLKPGQTLDDLIKQVSAIEDPTLRAKKAIELFGAKGGVALANVLKPGITSLDQFAVSSQDSATAVDDSVNALDSSLGAKLNKIVSQAKATLRGFGADFGPAVTGIASLASLAGALIPDSLSRKISAGLTKAIVGGFAKAEIGTRLETLGLKAQTFWIKGLTKADRVGDAIGDAIFAAQGNSKVMAANDALGKLMGSTLGKAFSVAFAAVALVELGKTFADIKEQLDAQAKDLTAKTADWTATATQAQLEAQLKAVQDAKAKIASFVGSGPASPAIAFLLGGQVDQLSAQEKAIQAKLDAIVNSVSNAVDQSQAAFQPLGEHAAQATAAGVQSGAPAVTEAAVTMVDDATAAAGYAANKKAFEAGKAIPDNTAAGMRSRRDAVVSAFDDLKDFLRNALTPVGEQSRLVGELFSKRLAAGMKSGDPIVRKRAIEVRTTILDRLAELASQGVPLGKKGAQALADGLRSKNPQVRQSAQLLAKVVENTLDHTKKPAGNAGQAAGKAFADRLRAEIAASMALGITIRAHFVSDTHGKAIGGPVAAGTPYLVGERGPELFVPGNNGRILDHAKSVQAVQGAGGNQFNITVHAGNDISPQQARHFGQRIADEVVKTFRDQSARTSGVTRRGL